MIIKATHAIITFAFIVNDFNESKLCNTFLAAHWAAVQVSTEQKAYWYSSLYIPSRDVLDPFATVSGTCLLHTVRKENTNDLPSSKGVACVALRRNEIRTTKPLRMSTLVVSK